MIEDEIPEAVKEFWPRLRRLAEFEVLQLVKEEQIRAATPDYQVLGIMSVCLTKLLDRLDLALTPEIAAKQTQTAPRRRVAQLESQSPQNKP